MTPSTFENTYRQFFMASAEPLADFEAWLKRNRLAFMVLNPNTTDEQFAAAFHIFMYETYEGQLPRA